MDYYDPRRRVLRAVRQLLYPRECPFCGRVLWRWATVWCSWPLAGN